MTGPAVARLAAPVFERAIDDLAALLVDVVDGGASIGFLRPLALADAKAFWRSLADEVRAESVVVLAASVDDRLAGTAQLRLAPLPNARHRAEVAKVMVRTSLRRHGIAKTLMAAIEDEARRRARTLLVLDTETESAGEPFYEALGWKRTGEIPRYAQNADRELRSTTIYYKEVT